MTKAIGLLLIAALAASVAPAPPPAGNSNDDASKSASRSPSHSAEPRADWELSFPMEISIDEYARQLDYFKIEIAAISKDGRAEYASGVSTRKPGKRVGKQSEDQRLNIGWKSGTLHAVDRRLLSKAGISSQRKELLHYFPYETQLLMKQVERAYAKRDPREIKRTRFEIHPRESRGYEFVVVEQDPPRPRQDDPPTSSLHERADN